MRLPQVWLEWEYKAIALSASMDTDTDGATLDSYGRDGWEIVYCSGEAALLKRPRTQTKERIETKG